MKNQFLILGSLKTLIINKICLVRRKIKYVLQIKSISTLTLLLVTSSVFAQVVISTDEVSSYAIEARIRNGKTGFEAALFTPSTPAPGAPGGGEWQLDPPGAPVWNANGNHYGDLHDFRVAYDFLTGTSSISIDFNRDGDFNDIEESTTNTSAGLAGENFSHINLFLQGSTGGETALVSDFNINGTPLGTHASTSEVPLSLILENMSGSFGNIIITGKVSFSGGVSHEIPRVWIRLGSAESCVPVVTPIPPAEKIGTCQVLVDEYPIALNGCGDTLTGMTSDPLLYTETGSFVITWIFDDGMGHSASCQQHVTVTDATAPLPDILVLPEIRGVCSAEIIHIPTATDNCKGLIHAATSDPLVYTEIGTYTVTWSYNDLSGNSITQLQTVVVDSVQTNCPEDINRDTNIDGLDYLIILGKMFNTCSCCLEDFNHNHLIDGDDYLRLLGKFGRKCDE